MYTPHTVTVYNFDDSDNPNITILEGVFLDISEGENIMKSGLENADKVTLYIPLSIKGINAQTGQEQQYLPVKEYERKEDKAGFWTIGKHGKGAGNDCFFIKDKVIEPEMSYSELNDFYDFCYNVSTVDLRDFGSPDMHHLQVGGS